MYEDKIDLIVERVSNEFDPKAIIVFGSVANGTSNENSDLDIAIIMETDLPMTKRIIGIRRAIGVIGMDLDILIFTPEEVEVERKDPCSLVSEILKTGKTVYGTICADR